MIEHAKCNQAGCSNAPAFRFTWPGRDEQAICAAHAPKLRAVSGALGFQLQLIPLPPGEPCHKAVDKMPAEEIDPYRGSMGGPGGSRRCGD